MANLHHSPILAYGSSKKMSRTLCGKKCSNRAIPSPHRHMRDYIATVNRPVHWHRGEWRVHGLGFD